MTKHGKSTRLSICRWFAAFALGGLALTANAFEQLTPPAGWSAGGGAGGSVTGTKTAVNSMFTTTGVSSNASIRVSGRSVPIPALMKYTPQAQRAAAAAVMLHPGIRTAAAVAGWLGLAGLVYDQASGLWQMPASTASQVPISTGFEFMNSSGQWVADWDAACKSFRSDYFARVGGEPGLCGFPGGNFVAQSLQRRYSSQCPAGWYITPAGCVQTLPPRTVTQEEAIEELTKHPMPADVPRHIPEPLPVDLPEYQPMFIPTGNPVPNPSYNPSQPVSPSNQPFVQPGVKVEPAPSPSAPWQVDVKPVNRPTESPTGSTEPTTEPSTETPREPQKEDRDFCEKNPDVLACAEADTPEQETPKGELNISYEYVDIFGNGSCPSDSYLNTHGQSLKVWDWAATCQNVQSYFRPILIACCAFAAFVIVSAGAKE